MAGGVLLQSAATSGNGNEFHCRGEQGTYALAVIGAGTITGGDVQWEQALTTGYAGTWAPLGSPLTPVEDTIVTQVYTGNLQRVRARIANAITGGGSVTVTMQPPLVGQES